MSKRRRREVEDSAEDGGPRFVYTNSGYPNSCDTVMYTDNFTKWSSFDH